MNKKLLEELVSGVGADPTFFTNIKNFADANKWLTGVIKQGVNYLHTDKSREDEKDFKKFLDNKKKIEEIGAGKVYWEIKKQSSSKQSSSKIKLNNKISKDELTKFAFGEYQSNLREQFANKKFICSDINEVYNPKHVFSIEYFKSHDKIRSKIYEDVKEFRDKQIKDLNKKIDSVNNNVSSIKQNQNEINNSITKLKDLLGNYEANPSNKEFLLESYVSLIDEIKSNKNLKDTFEELETKTLDLAIVNQIEKTHTDITRTLKEEKSIDTKKKYLTSQINSLNEFYSLNSDNELDNISLLENYLKSLNKLSMSSNLDSDFRKLSWILNNNDDEFTDKTSRSNKNVMLSVLAKKRRNLYAGLKEEGLFEFYDVLKSTVTGVYREKNDILLVQKFKNDLNTKTQTNVLSTSKDYLGAGAKDLSLLAKKMKKLYVGVKDKGIFEFNNVLKSTINKIRREKNDFLLVQKSNDKKARERKVKDTFLNSKNYINRGIKKLSELVEDHSIEIHKYNNKIRRYDYTMNKLKSEINVDEELKELNYVEISNIYTDIIDDKEKWIIGNEKTDETQTRAIFEFDNSLEINYKTLNEEFDVKPTGRYLVGTVYMPALQHELKNFEVENNPSLKGDGLNAKDIMGTFYATQINLMDLIEPEAKIGNTIISYDSNTNSLFFEGKIINNPHSNL